MLADIDISDAFQPWLAGGTLEGIGKMDKEGSKYKTFEGNSISYNKA